MKLNKTITVKKTHRNFKIYFSHFFPTLAIVARLYTHGTAQCCRDVCYFTNVVCYFTSDTCYLVRYACYFIRVCLLELKMYKIYFIKIQKIIYIYKLYFNFDYKQEKFGAMPPNPHYLF